MARSWIIKDVCWTPPDLPYARRVQMGIAYTFVPGAAVQKSIHSCGRSDWMV